MSSNNFKLSDGEMKLIMKLVNGYSKISSEILDVDDEIHEIVPVIASLCFMHCYAIQTDINIDTLRAEFEEAYPIAVRWLEQMKKSGMIESADIKPAKTELLN